MSKVAELRTRNLNPSRSTICRSKPGRSVNSRKHPSNASVLHSRLLESDGRGPISWVRVRFAQAAALSVVSDLGFDTVPGLDWEHRSQAQRPDSDQPVERAGYLFDELAAAPRGFHPSLSSVVLPYSTRRESSASHSATSCRALTNWPSGHFAIND